MVLSQIKREKKKKKGKKEIGRKERKKIRKAGCGGNHQWDLLKRRGQLKSPETKEALKIK